MIQKSAPDSLMTTVRARAHEALVARMAAEGYPFVPGGLERVVLDRAMDNLRGLPASQLAGLSITSAPLLTAVQTSFAATMSQLSEPQQRALKQGLDPYNQAVIQALAVPGALGRPAAGIQIEAGEGTRSGSRFASLRSADEAREAEVRQYSGLGLGTATTSTFLAIGLDRAAYDLYRQQGFSQTHIVAAARDAQTLGFRGREDVDIAVKAPNDLRGAAAAIAKATTPEEKAAAQKHYDDLVKKYQDLPDSDPRKADALKFIQRVDGKFGEKRLETGNDAAARDLTTAARVNTTIEAIGERNAETIVKDGIAEVKQTTKVERTSDADDVFGEALPVDAKPTVVAKADEPAVKPDPVPKKDVAEAKPDVAAVDPKKAKPSPKPSGMTA